MTQIDMNGMVMTPHAMAFSIERTVKEEKVRKDFLRIVVSEVQRRVLWHALWIVSDPASCRYESEHGCPESFMFCGVSVILDESMPDNQARIDVVRKFETVGIINKISLPAIDHRYKETQR